MKKIFGVLLSISIIASSITSFADGVTFTDISESKYAWAKPYIEEMAKNGYIAGYDDNTYRPDNKVTRLETIVLFSRAMGANVKQNKEIIEFAMDEYEDIIKSAKLNFGEEEIAYMLYRGALSKDDVNKFLASGNASKPMQRQEAAMIITRAMCGEEKAKSEVLVDLEYTDAKQIDSAYSQYVFYVSENGIMNGMDDGTFSPATSVSRSQIAVMLYRAVDKMDFYIETVVVPDIETDSNNITIIDEDRQELKIGYQEDTKFFVDNKLATENDFVKGSEATLTYIGKEHLAFVDMHGKASNENLRGIFQGYTSEYGKTSITIKPDNAQEAIVYEAYESVTAYNIDGAATQFKNIPGGSYVEYSMTGDKIISVRQINKESAITGAVIEEIGISDDLYIKISHSNKEYDGKVFFLNDDVKVYKNDDVEDLSKLYKGDRVDLKFEYGVVIRVNATSNVKTYEGVISELSISSQPIMKIKINGEVQIFEVLSDVKISLNGEDATLYDLRVGDSVKISVESDAIMKITATTATASSAQVSGVIDVVNKSKRFLKVNGGDPIFFTDTTTIVTSQGVLKSTRDLKEGQKVFVWGTLQNGGYNTTLIVIE